MHGNIYNNINMCEDDLSHGGLRHQRLFSPEKSNNFARVFLGDEYLMRFLCSGAFTSLKINF
jgi:hypothetical protein